MNARTIITALVLVAGGAAQALTPLPPCDGPEGGMMVYGVDYFGHDRTGFVIEGYRNLDAGNVIGGAKGPVEALNDFSGVRITDCRTGRMLAIHGVFPDVQDMMTATEFLRGKVQAEKAIAMRDVEKAAKALWGKDGYVRLVKLRETEETCACGEYFPGVWK